jgi:HEAT repeat protein
MVLKSPRLPLLLALAALPFFQTARAGTVPKEQTVPELINIVKNNPDQEAKLNAIRKLATISEADERNNNVTEVLIEITGKTQDPFIGMEAPRVLAALYKNGIQRTKVKYLEPFTLLLKDPRTNPAVRSGIAANFMETLDKEGLKDKKAFDVLVEIAKNRREENLALRADCVKGIGNFGNPDNIGMLTDLLADPDPFIREAAAKGITFLLDKDMAAGAGINLAGVNKLIDMMRDETLEDSLRVIVIRAVSQLIAAGAPGAIRGLEDIIKLVKTSTKDPIVAACIDGLGIIGTAQAADPLISTYKDYLDEKDHKKERDWPVRQRVAKALRNLLNVQANKANPELPVVHNVAALLVKIVDADQVADVKGSAVIALANLYPKKFEAEHKEATAALIYLLEKTTTDENMKSTIPISLQSITRVNFGPDAKRWKEWWQTKYKAALPN